MIQLFSCFSQPPSNFQAAQMVYHQNPGVLTDPNQGAKVFAGKVLQPSWAPLGAGEKNGSAVTLSGERKHLQMTKDTREFPPKLSNSKVHQLHQVHQTREVHQTPENLIVISSYLIILMGANSCTTSPGWLKPQQNTGM